MRLAISLLSLILLFLSQRGGGLIQAADPGTNTDKHHSVDSPQNVEQFVAPSFYETVQLAINLTVWGLNYAGTVLEIVKDWGGLGDLCPYSPHPVDSVASAMSLGIKAQPLARKTITSAVEAWAFDFYAGKNQPLVVALTGPTGVGKTETAWIIAEALLLSHVTYMHGSRGAQRIPRGLISFRGEDFSDPNMPPHEYRTRIKTALLDTLKICSGHAVVLFDEVQKVVPGTLDVLLEAMGEHPVLTYYSHGHAVTVDASRVIFILISDIGAEAILDVLLHYPSREEVPLGKLRSVVKKALDKQWERLQFGKVVDRVVPYLPMGPREILQVMELKLSQMEQEFKGKYFSSLHTTEELRWHLCSRAYINYGNFSTPESLGKGISHLFAVYGARNIENDGPLKALKSKMLKHLQPWRLDQAVDIRYDQESRYVIFRWCQETCFSGPAGSEDMEGLNLDCEVAWEGQLYEHSTVKHQLPDNLNNISFDSR